MCNAHNHAFDCDCGFGGDTGGGGGRRLAIALAMLERPISSGWARDSRGTVESYVNPNAHCPVCGALVYFYRSPYDGRVFFDELGWPWPKHPCTDNRREPLRAKRDSAQSSVPRPTPKWRIRGWHPLLASKVYAGRDRRRVTGDLEGRFREFHLPGAELPDANSPVFVRARAAMPDLFQVTFVHSDHFGIQRRKATAFDPRIASVGDDMILKAASGDAVASCAVGHYVLWELDDPAGARPYLESAGAAGVFDALVDLAVLELLRAKK
jgi:hypothetical protein